MNVTVAIAAEAIGVTPRKKMQDRTPDAGLVKEDKRDPQFPKLPPIQWPSDVTPWRAGNLADTPEIPDRQAMTRAQGMTGGAKATVHKGGQAAGGQG